MATAKTVISTVGSIAATAMVARSIARDYLPPEIQNYFYLGLHNLFRYFSNQLTIVIEEYDGLVTNEIYEAAALYLGSKFSPKTRRLKATKPEKERTIKLAMERNEEVTETYKGAQFKWVWICHKINEQSRRFYYDPYNMMNPSMGSETRCFELTFHKKHKDLAITSYLPFILGQAKNKKQETKTLKIFTVNTDQMYSSRSDSWKSVNLDHPATFETVAMEAEAKEMVIKDLDRFVKRREKYRRVGKAWKRGYLLYGPPGTGKSSLIAAMANYLKFDIYDLELTEVMRNADLRKLLIGTANRSILVVEDIDCTIELQDRMNQAPPSNVPRHRGFPYQEDRKVTLSGFLNFIDGLWSSIGDERIIIFTTNHKKKLDPALLRPGRMDLHVHMSYCTPCGFKLLAENYLGIKNHELFEKIEKLVEGMEVTPAEVAEQLLKSDEPDVSLSGLIEFFGVKMKENIEAKAKKALEEEKEKNKIKECDDDESMEENVELLAQ